MKSMILVSLMLGPAAALARTQPDQSDTCRKYLQTALPVEAQAVPSPKKWPNCDSYKSYSGLGRPLSFESARECAWRERLAQQAELEPRYEVSSVFGGSAMLTVLYANGEGVQRNIPLALRFACEAGGAPAEIRYRTQSLLALQSKSPTTRFDFCQDITSGFMQGFCAAYSSEMAEQKRASAIDALTSRWPAEQRAAFTHLASAQKSYAEEHARSEIDLSGTARAMYQIDAEDSLLDDFQTAIAAFEKGNLPHASQTDSVESDRKLNEVYRKRLAEAEAHKTDYGAVQPEGIRSAELAWLRYRDAFIDFAHLHYPSVSRDTWFTLLTSDRISVLDGSFCDMDAVDGPCAWKGDTWKPNPLP